MELQHKALEKYGFTTVSFDADFDRTKRGRRCDRRETEDRGRELLAGSRSHDRPLITPVSCPSSLVGLPDRRPKTGDGGE